MLRFLLAEDFLWCPMVQFGTALTAALAAGRVVDMVDWDLLQRSLVRQVFHQYGLGNVNATALGDLRSIALGAEPGEDRGA